MPFSRITYEYSGQSTFALNFTLGYLEQSHVTCRVNDEVDGGGNPSYRTITWITSGTVSISGSLETGDTIVFERTTPKNITQNDFQNGSLLIEKNLDDSFLQAIMIAHEALDGRLGTVGADINMGSNQIKNMAEPTEPQDAATKNYIDNFEALNTTLILGYRNEAEGFAEAAEDERILAEAARDDAETAQAGAEAAETNVISKINELKFNSERVSFADSPVTAVAGAYYIVDTSGGDVVINLPAIDVVGEPTNIGVQKSTSDTNQITINPGGTDQIAGQSEYLVTNVGSVELIADELGATDNWAAISSGAGAGQPKEQLFVEGADFDAGVDNSITITNTPAPVSSAGLHVFMDGVAQHSNVWSYDPDTNVVTFTETIPSSVVSIYTKWSVGNLPIGTPGDGTVSLSKLASGLLGTATDIMNGLVSKLATCKSVFDYAQPKWIYGSEVDLTAGGGSSPKEVLSGISSSASEVVLEFSGVSTSASNDTLLQLSNGSYITSGYTSVTTVASTGVNTFNSTTGFIFSQAATNIVDGFVTLHKINGNKWSCSFVLTRGSGATTFGSGNVTLTGSLEAIRVIILTSGVFDSGTITGKYR